VCMRVETDYEEVPDEVGRVEKIVQVLSEGIHAYLRKRGMLARANTGHNPPPVAPESECEIPDE
jgi:hypothetical protein